MVQLGLVPLGAGLLQTGLTVLVVLSPHGSYWELDLQSCWACPLLGSGYRGQDFECWVLRELDFGWSDSQLRWAPCHADGAYREPRVLSCWAISFGRASYHGQTTECRVLWELDFPGATDRPGHLVGPALKFCQASRGFEHHECHLIRDPDRHLLGYGGQHKWYDWHWQCNTGSGQSPPVKAARSESTAGPAGSCQIAGSHESRSTPTHPGGPQVPTTMQQTLGCLQYQIIMTWHLTQNVCTRDSSIAANGCLWTYN